MIMTIQQADAVLVLPAPEFANSETIAATMALHRSMNGTIYTYVRELTPYTHHIQYRFILGREKVRETMTFFGNRIDKTFRVSEDWREQGIQWLAILKSDVLENIAVQLWRPQQDDAVRSEKTEITLDFIGYHP